MSSRCPVPIPFVGVPSTLLTACWVLGELFALLALPGFALVYWGAWVFLPDWLGTRLDLRKVLNPGWWIFWVTCLVITLPQMIRMWTEPDEVGDPKVVAIEREA